MIQQQQTRTDMRIFNPKSLNFLLNIFNLYPIKNNSFIEDRIINTRMELENAEEAFKNFRDSNRRIENSPTLQLEQQRLAREVSVLTGVFTTLKQQLETTKIGKETNAYKWYSGQIDINWVKKLRENNESFPESIPKKALITNGIPMLPPAHIHARARRYAVKIFLSHLFEIMFMNYHHVKPPKPYIIQHGGHSRYVAPPNLSNWLDEENIHIPE